MSKPLVYKSPRRGDWRIRHNNHPTRPFESHREAFEAALIEAQVSQVTRETLRIGAEFICQCREHVDDELAWLSIDTPPRHWEGSWP